MKKYFFTGFITLLPLTLTIVLVTWLFNFLTAPFAGIAESFILTYEKKLGIDIANTANLVAFLSRLFALVFLVLTIFILGICGQRFLNDFFLKIINKIFSRIPFVRSVYRLCLDITKALFADTKKTFKQTVLVPFPHQDVLSIGFLTGPTPDILRKEGGLTDCAIFVPTAPHPMSGFVLLTPQKLVRPVDVSVEDAFKFLISCGVIHPGESTTATKETPNNK